MEPGEFPRTIGLGGPAETEESAYALANLFQLKLNERGITEVFNKNVGYDETQKIWFCNMRYTANNTQEEEAANFSCTCEELESCRGSGM